MSVQLLRTVGETEVSILEMDATISHNISARAQVTEHQVEDGSTVADNVRNEPIEISVTGVVTNYPTRLGIGLPSFRDDLRAQTAQDALYEIRDNKELVTLVDELRTYRNMLMSSVDMPRDQETHNGLRFTAQFRQVTLVGAQVAQLDSSDDVQDTATPQADLGKQTANDSEPEDESKASLLYQIFVGDG